MCRVNTNQVNDRFVGLKSNSQGITIHFPIGYQLPDSEKEIKNDVLQLFQVLSDFTNSQERVLEMRNLDNLQSVNVPISSYLEIIRSYLEKGNYYMDSESIYKTSNRGKIDWSRTIKHQIPFIQNNFTPIYTQYVVRDNLLNENNIITHIHRYCVYESFSKLGWLFTPYMPAPPLIPLNVEYFIYTLNHKLISTNNDFEKRLFLSMKSLLENFNGETQNKHFYFGTEYFEVVWEKLVDKVFGIKNKDEYFPRTRWLLNKGQTKVKRPLEPDTVMIFNNKYYVLDAKYYKYGITGDPNDLPNSSSINKQITYGEYIYTQKKISNSKLFNAFIMPYNSKENNFELTKNFGNIGEAISEWKNNTKNYEKVQGIVVDTRYLMHHYTKEIEESTIALANAIEKSIIANSNIF